MHLIISNQTRDSLRCQFGKKAGNENITVRSFCISPRFPSHVCTSLWFSRLPDAGAKGLSTHEATEGEILVKPCTASGRTWQRVTVQGRSPWIIYRKRVSWKHHVLIVLPYRDTSCFLASIPNSVPLSSLMLPGTHETMAFYGWPISQCQYRPLDTQLHAGIRVIDIRLSIVDGRLIAYHGIFPEVTPFADMLVTLHGFLTAPTTASETVVVSIKQEDSNTQLFPKLVRQEIVASPGGLQMWFLENRIPTLGEVRGRAVMFSRFGCDGWEKCANGIHPSLWPDNSKEIFQWECEGTLVKTQDWYGIPTFLSIREKAALATELLIPPTDTSIPTLSISFSSASSVPWALPPIIARGLGWPKWGLGFEGVNERIGKWLLDHLTLDDAIDKHARLAPRSDPGPRIRGWLLTDYYEDPIRTGLVPLLVECNFRGRRSGEEGWPDL